MGEGALAFQLDDTLVGGGRVIGEGVVLLGQEPRARDLLRHLALEVGDLGAGDSQLVAQFALGDLGAAGLLLDDVELVAEPLTFGFMGRGALAEAVELGAQRLVALAHLVEGAAQADVFGLFLLEGAQRLADRVDQLAEGVLQVVERADPAAGIHKKLAENFVLAADAGAHIGPAFGPFLRLGLSCGRSVGELLGSR